MRCTTKYTSGNTNTKEAIMKTWKWITSLFQSGTYYQESVEKYIARKTPTNAAELEFWLKTFEREQLHRGGLL